MPVLVAPVNRDSIIMQVNPGGLLLRRAMADFEYAYDLPITFAIYTYYCFSFGANKSQMGMIRIFRSI